MLKQGLVAAAVTFALVGGAAQAATPAPKKEAAAAPSAKHVKAATPEQAKAPKAH